MWHVQSETPSVPPIDNILPATESMISQQMANDDDFLSLAECREIFQIEYENGLQGISTRQMVQLQQSIVELSATGSPEDAPLTEGIRQRIAKFPSANAAVPVVLLLTAIREHLTSSRVKLLSFAVATLPADPAKEAYIICHLIHSVLKAIEDTPDLPCTEADISALFDTFAARTAYMRRGLLQSLHPLVAALQDDPTPHATPHVCAALTGLLSAAVGHPPAVLSEAFALAVQLTVDGTMGQRLRIAMRQRLLSAPPSALVLPEALLAAVLRDHLAAIVLGRPAIVHSACLTLPGLFNVMTRSGLPPVAPAVWGWAQWLATQGKKSLRTSNPVRRATTDALARLTEWAADRGAVFGPLDPLDAVADPVGWRMVTSHPPEEADDDATDDEMALPTIVDDTDRARGRPAMPMVPDVGEGHTPRARAVVQPPAAETPSVPAEVPRAVSMEIPVDPTPPHSPSPSPTPMQEEDGDQRPGGDVVETRPTQPEAPVDPTLEPEEEPAAGPTDTDPVPDDVPGHDLVVDDKSGPVTYDGELGPAPVRVGVGAEGGQSEEPTDQVEPEPEPEVEPQPEVEPEPEPEPEVAPEPEPEPEPEVVEAVEVVVRNVIRPTPTPQPPLTVENVPQPTVEPAEIEMEPTPETEEAPAPAPLVADVAEAPLIVDDAPSPARDDRPPSIEDCSARDAAFTSHHVSTMLASVDDLIADLSSGELSSFEGIDCHAAIGRARLGMKQGLEDMARETLLQLADIRQTFLQSANELREKTGRQIRMATAIGDRNSQVVRSSPASRIVSRTPVHVAPLPPSPAPPQYRPCTTRSARDKAYSGYVASSAGGVVGGSAASGVGRRSMVKPNLHSVASPSVLYQQRMSNLDAKLVEFRRKHRPGPAFK